MKLTINDKEVEAKITQKITPKLKIEFLKKLGELKENPLQKKIIEAAKGAVMDGDNVRPMNVGNTLEFAELQKQAPPIDIIQHNDKVYIELFKLIVTNKVPEFESEEFWENQDINGIIEAVQSFRARIQF